MKGHVVIVGADKEGEKKKGWRPPPPVKSRPKATFADRQTIPAPAGALEKLAKHGPEGVSFPAPGSKGDPTEDSTEMLLDEDLVSLAAPLPPPAPAPVGPGVPTPGDAAAPGPPQPAAVANKAQSPAPAPTPAVTAAPAAPALSAVTPALVTKPASAGDAAPQPPAQQRASSEPIVPRPDVDAPATRTKPPTAGVWKLAVVASFALLLGVGAWVFLAGDPDQTPAAREPGVPAETPSLGGQDALAAPEPVAGDAPAPEAAPATTALEEPQSAKATARDDSTEQDVPPEPAPQEAPAKPLAQPAVQEGSKPEASRSKEPAAPERDEEASDALVEDARQAAGEGAPMEQIVRTLKEALELDPRNPHAAAGLAKMALKRGDAPEAIHWAEMAVKLRSRRARYYIMYGDALKLGGQDALARQAWQQALELNRDSRSAKNRLGL